MSIDFVKYQSLGNDFIILDSSAQEQLQPNVDWHSFVKNICSRHFGVGADGLLVVRKDEGGNLRAQ